MTWWTQLSKLFKNFINPNQYLPKTAFHNKPFPEGHLPIQIIPKLTKKTQEQRPGSCVPGGDVPEAGAG